MTTTALKLIGLRVALACHPFGEGSCTQGLDRRDSNNR
jgi:hypothetical protein